MTPPTSTVELSACDDDLPDQIVSTSRLRVFIPARVNGGQNRQRWAAPGAPCLRHPSGKGAPLGPRVVAALSKRAGLLERWVAT